MEDIRIEYDLKFEGGRKWSYVVALDPKNLSLVAEENSKKLPEWTKLEVEQCEGCPLSVNENPYCPIAVELSALVEKFKDEISYTQVAVKVKTPERDYFKQVSVQEALLSIFGLIMATSGCPVMNYLKPMARFHLPFASMEESIIRSVSMHLLRQYFQKLKGKEADFELKKLDKKYEQIQKVNMGLSRRIRQVLKAGDANQNTVTTFHCISKMLSMSINRNLRNYEYLFQDD